MTHTLDSKQDTRPKQNTVSTCRNLCRIFHQRMQARELVIGNERIQNNPLPAHQIAKRHVNVIVHVGQDEPFSFNKEFEDMHAVEMVTSSITNSLMETPNFRHFFDQLGFSKEYRKKAATKLVKIDERQYGECNMVGRPLGKMANGYENAIVFTEADMCTLHPYHNKPLYVESVINKYPIKRTFIDDGSSVNLMLLSTLKAVNIDMKSLRRPMTIIDQKSTRLNSSHRP